MAHVTIEFWGLLLNAFGICICVVAILYMLFRHSRSISSNKDKEPYNNFNNVLLQMIKQSETAFATISDTLKRERMVLKAALEKEAKKQINAVSEATAIEGGRYLPEGIQGNLVDDKYAEVARLAKLGLRTKDISEKVELPKGEIDLFIKLRNKDNKFKRESQAQLETLS